MAIPSPKKNETKKQFTDRFMKSKTVTKDFPTKKKRMAVGLNIWNHNKYGRRPKITPFNKLGYKLTRR